jgi:hypothetical protein
MDYTTLLLVAALAVAQSVSLRPLSTPTRSVTQQTATAAAAAPALDYEVFKARVQPILTSSRKGNARCIACHSRGGGNAYLEPLPPGTTTYTGSSRVEISNECRGSSSPATR